MNQHSTLQETLLRLVRTLPSVQVQNRLMAATDRDIALALLGMETHDEREVLAHLSPRKADRVREELALEERRRVAPKHALYSLGLLITSLEGNRAVAGRRSYVRPHRPERA